MSQRIVEILAPAGSPESLAAALEHGADAVYLGLKEFNARGNAINFSLEELAYYVPLAHERGTKVYLTLNTIVKMNEMSPLLESLARAADCGIDGAIIQDLGLARTMARHFPKLRRHASTQLAIHNLEGVRFCVDAGFRRVVLARELTLGEIADIRAAFPPEVIELEVFCHGAMCYTYSGMCFFSGSVGGRSGNRGECAYTCRKGYKILNQTTFPAVPEPNGYHNYLFSMKDMNTLEILGDLIKSGVDSLKIEGRRKGPAYVGSSVDAYREGRAREMAVQTGADPARAEALDRDLKLSFARDFTKAFFVRGQFGDAPIDLENTSSKGIEIGVLEADSSFTLLEAGIQRYDGVRLLFPNMKEMTLSFNAYQVAKGDRHRPEKGARIRLEGNYPAGTRIYWVKAQEVEQRYRPDKGLLDRSAAIPAPVRIQVQVLTLEATQDGPVWQLVVSAASDYAKTERRLTLSHSRSGKPLPLRETLYRFGDMPLRPERYDGPETHQGFAPLSQLKQLRRELLTELSERVSSNRDGVIRELVRQACNPKQEPEADFQIDPNQNEQHILRLDRIELLEEASAFARERGFKLDYLPRQTLSTPDWKRAKALLRDSAPGFRIVLPMVLRKWDLRLLRTRLNDLADLGCELVLSNPGHFPLLASLASTGARLHADFSLYHLNSWAYRALLERGINGRFTLSLEDDKPNMEALLRATHPSRFEAIAYTDTPLFIAEACSLAALYGGCPGAKTCGHETLFIENEHGDRFEVRHDRCRSTVVGANPLSWSGHLDWFRQRGVRFFRSDFTVRPYTLGEIEKIMSAVSANQKIQNSHTENLERVLL